MDGLDIILAVVFGVILATCVAALFLAARIRRRRAQRQREAWGVGAAPAAWPTPPSAPASARAPAVRATGHNEPNWLTSPAALAADPDAFLLAAGDVYAICWGSPLDAFAFAGTADDAERLADAWGVHDGDGVLDAALGMLLHGHRRRFGPQRDAWAALGDVDAARTRSGLAERAARFGGEEAEDLWRFDAVRADSYGIREVDLAAYDLVRAIMLLRAGAGLGWLPVPLARDLAAVAAAGLQGAYPSWQELGRAFSVGRWYWNGEGGASEQALLAHESERAAVLTGARGPWPWVPWDRPVPPPRPGLVAELRRRGLALDLPAAPLRPWERVLVDPAAR